MPDKRPGDEVADVGTGLGNVVVGAAVFAGDPKLKMPLAELITGEGVSSGFLSPSASS